MAVLFRLDELLEERNMSQRELSRRTGIRQASISDIALNKAERPPMKNLELICQALHCDLSDLVVFTREDPLIPETIEGVEEVLRRHPDNLMARKWLIDEEMKRQLLDDHLSWNEDHEKAGEPNMIFSLDVNVEYSLDHAHFKEEEKNRP